MCALRIPGTNTREELKNLELLISSLFHFVFSIFVANPSFSHVQTCETSIDSPDGVENLCAVQVLAVSTKINTVVLNNLALGSI